MYNVTYDGTVSEQSGKAHMCYNAGLDSRDVPDEALCRVGDKLKLGGGFALP